MPRYRKYAKLYFSFPPLYNRCNRINFSEARRRNPFHEDVFRRLKDLVTVSNALESERYSSYYHKIGMFHSYIYFDNYLVNG